MGVESCLPQDALVKYYDIEREAQRADYTIHNGGLPGAPGFGGR